MMLYSYNRLLVLFVCLLIIIDGTDALRVRGAAIRVSTHHGKSSNCNKKKIPTNNNHGLGIAAKPIPLKVLPGEGNTEF
jgi:hypothetical protein